MSLSGQADRFHMSDRFSGKIMRIFKKKKGCTERAAVIELFLGEKSVEEKSRLLSHIMTCAECLPLLAAAQELSTQGDAILKKLQGTDWEKLDVRSLRQRARAEIQSLRARRKARKRSILPKLRIPAIAATACALLLISVLLLVRAPRTDDRERSPGQWQVLLLEPRGETKLGSLVFEWTLLKEAQSYTLEIFDKLLNPVYQSAPLTRKSFTLPDNVSCDLVSGQVYFWKISAHLEDNQTFESEFGKFRIKKN
jgi:hypothetical protein